MEKCESLVEESSCAWRESRQSSSGSWVTMWMSTAGDSRKEAVRYAEVEKFFPIAGRGAAEDDLGDVFGADGKSAMASATLGPLRRTTSAPRFSAKRRLASRILGFSSRVANSRITWTT